LNDIQPLHLNLHTFRNIQAKPTPSIKFG